MSTLCGLGGRQGSDVLQAPAPRRVQPSCHGAGSYGFSASRRAAACVVTIDAGGSRAACQPPPSACTGSTAAVISLTRRVTSVNSLQKRIATRIAEPGSVAPNLPPSRSRHSRGAGLHCARVLRLSRELPAISAGGPGQRTADRMPNPIPCPADRSRRLQLPAISICITQLLWLMCGPNRRASALPRPHSGHGHKNPDQP